MTTTDVEGAIALAILSDKAAFIRAMLANGIVVAPGISDDDLYALAISAWAQKGFSVIRNVLNSVTLNRTLLTTAQQNIVIKKFGLQTNPQLKCDWQHPLECVTGFTGYVGDLLGGSGSSVSTGPSQTQTSSSPLSPIMLGLIVVVGIILMVIFRKFTALVVGIIVVVLGVVLYGIFAKQINTIITGGTTTSTTHGGIGAAIASLFV